MTHVARVSMLVLLFGGLPLVSGCAAARGPVPPAPADGSALGRSAPAPVLDAADDPDTVSPVEAGDLPGDAGTHTAGASLAPAGVPASVEVPRPSCCLPANPRLRALTGGLSGAP